MTKMVQAILASDLAEAEEIQTILRSAGIQSELESAVETHPTALADAPQKVLVPEDLPRGGSGRHRGDDRPG